MAKTEKSDSACRFITPEFRVSYPHLFKPNAIKGSEPKFSVSMLVPKTKDLSKFKLAMKHAMIEKYGPNKKNWPADIENPILDGDSPKFAGKEGHKGHYVIKASTGADYKPGVVDKDGDDIIDPADIYPGCYARAAVFARVWEFADKIGIHFILDHVQKLRDGKSFSSKKSAQEVFGAAAVEGSGEGEEESEETESFLD